METVKHWSDLGRWSYPMAIMHYSGGSVFTLVVNPVIMWNLEFEVKFLIEGHGQSTRKQMGS